MNTAVLVDDDPIARLSLKALLAQCAPDFTVSGEAASLEEANELIRQVCPSVVFLDIHLPDGNGVDLVARIKGSVRIVFVSVSNDYAFRAFEVNALDYLQKPVSPERLAGAGCCSSSSCRRSAPNAKPTAPSGMLKRLPVEITVFSKSSREWLRSVVSISAAPAIAVLFGSGFRK